jgi:hypothetical protein
MDTVLTTHDVKMVQALLLPLREVELGLTAQYRLDQLMNEAYQEWRKNMNDIVLNYTVTIKHGVAIRMECHVTSQTAGVVNVLSATVDMLPEVR